MTVAYPLTVQFDYTELKYSLRSIEKFLPQPFEVVIVGNYLPEWINNVIQIEVPDVPGRKQLSIRKKILAALEYAEEILFLNDDVFLLRPSPYHVADDVDWLEKYLMFPYFWHGMLKNYSESGSKPLMKELEKMGKPAKHFDGHYPLIYGQNFKELSVKFSEDVIIKSMYCNALGIEGVFIPDCKLHASQAKPEIIREFIKDKPCFSTGSYSLASALPILHELFSERSKYEI